MKKNFLYIFLILHLSIWNCSAEPFSFEQDSLLPKLLSSEVAFVFSTRMETDNLLVVQWHIAEGYYLYRDHIQFVLEKGILGAPQFPQGILKKDVKYDQVEVYEHLLEIKIPITDTQGLDTLRTTYQGCADDRMCYPPITKTVMLDLAETTSEDDIWAEEDEEEIEFLKGDEAFIVSVSKMDASHLVIRWKIADGYYLYQDKLAFSLESQGTLGTPELPDSILKADPVFGDVQIYQQPLLEIIVPIQKAEQQPITVSVKYQGCAVKGLCYPPTTKTITVGAKPVVSEQNRLASLLANDNILYTILIFFGLGLLLSLTPCIFPMIPILSSIIVGQGEKVTTYRAFIMSLVYVLAMASTYAIAGVLTGLLGENLQAAFQNPWILISFALVFVALSLSMFGFYELQLPNALQSKLTVWSNRQQGGTLIGVAIMGVLSALIVGPCVAAPLVGALIYISQTGNALLGGIALFTMSLGMGIPLIIIGTSAGHFLPKAGKWMDGVKATFGVMLLAVAIWMLERIVPGEVTMLLCASLLIISAVYMGALENLGSGVSGWQKLWKGLGLLFIIYGVFLMIGAARGTVNLLQPLHTPTFQVNNPVQSDLNSNGFKAIKGVSGLQEALAEAKAQNKPVMLDFYADWCISCKEMEKFTFHNPQVQALLKDFVLLQADVTPNDAQDKALYKHFGIFGPPAILFFDSQGEEQNAYRIAGFMPADEFQQHLNKVLQP